MTAGEVDLLAAYAVQVANLERFARQVAAESTIIETSQGRTRHPLIGSLNDAASQVRHLIRALRLVRDGRRSAPTTELSVDLAEVEQFLAENWKDASAGGAELRVRVLGSLPGADRRKLDAYCALHEVAGDRALVMSNTTSGDVEDENHHTWARAVKLMQRLAVELNIPPRLRSPFHDEGPPRIASRACAFASLLRAKPDHAAAEGAP